MIFFLSNSFSGHTLLALCLNSHPDISCLGDTILIEDRKGRAFCSCGKLTTEDEFWIKVYSLKYYSEIEKSIFQKDIIFRLSYYFPNLPFLHRWLNNSEKAIKFARIFDEFYQFMLFHTKCKKYIHGQKRIDLVNFFSSQRKNIWIIHLSKNPYEFVASMKHRKYTHEKDIKLYSKIWVRYNSRAIMLKEYNENCNYLHVDYSSFCENPENELSKICDFIDLNYDNRMMNLDPKSQHLIGADSVVKNFNGIIQKRDKIDLLSNEEKKKISKITYKVALKLGYKYEEEQFKYTR